MRSDPPKWSKNPYLTGILAEVFPGAGYFYLGDYRSAFLSSSLILPMAAQYYVTTPSFLTKSLKANLGTASRNLFGYTVYDSFQSAMTDEDRKNQIVPIPHYRFSELYFAPFRGNSYSSWKMWVPIGLAGITFASRLASTGINPDMTPARALVAILFILAQTFMIGVGEESEFRGFQQPAFSQLTRSPWLGNALQSMSFGLCHTRWGVCASPYVTGQIFRATQTIDPNTEYVAPSSPSDGGNTPDLTYFLGTAIYGLWWGWIVQSEEHGLLKTITSHALVDALLITSDMLTTNKTGRFYMSMSFPLPL
jgi:membrane protease YdiL (CAAX protease family)